jgi:hypothetical protein
MKRKTKSTTKTAKGLKTVSESGTQKSRRMLLPAELRAKADEIFATQPAIAKYIRGPQTAAKLSAEEFLVCLTYEYLEDQLTDLPIVTAADLQAKEAAVRAELNAIPDSKLSAPDWATCKDDTIAMLCRVGVVEPVSEKTAAITKLQAVTACLLESFKQNKRRAPAAQKFFDKSAFALKVEGRRDLTELKKRILKKGGQHFQRNAWIAPQVPPGCCKRLLIDGRFIAGSDAILHRMRMRGCHENARRLASRKGVELWTGFGLLEGCWRVHSWCVEAKRVVETTMLHELYYGIPVRQPFHDFFTKILERFGKPAANAKR